MATLDWFVVSPVGESQDTGAAPAGSKVISVVQGSSDENTLEQGGSIGGFVRYLGPYSTQAEAQNAKPSTANPLLTGIGSGLGLAGTNGISIGNPLTGLVAVGDFFQRLTQASTWIRIAEVLLGFGLLVVGLSKLTGVTSVLEKVGKVV